MGVVGFGEDLDLDLPNGRPRGPPAKARAVELDETLQQAAHLRQNVENLNARQQQATKKMKDHKSTLQRLREQAEALRVQLEAAQAEAARRKMDPAVQAKLEKLHAEHAVLHATQSWTKSSLDSALAAQEEYRKGYSSLRAAFEKARGEQEKKAKQLERVREARHELEATRAKISSGELEFQEDRRDAEEALRRIVERQKKKSKSVLDRFLSGQAGTLIQLTFQNWSKAVEEEKLSRETADALAETQRRLKDVQARKKDAASRVLERLSAASAAGLAGAALQQWSKQARDVARERQEAAGLQERLKKQKLEARKALERNLGVSVSGIMTNAFSDWLSYYREAKQVREMKEQAERKMREYQSKKKGDSVSVIERMAGQKTAVLLQQVFTCWLLASTDESSNRKAQEKLQDEVDGLEDVLKRLREEIAQKVEKLEDTSEELKESRRKNALLREEFRNIVALQENMDASIKEIVA